MAYSDILKLKKVEENKEEVMFTKNLVVGSDVFAIDLFLKLDAKESGRTKILVDEPLSEENLNLHGPSLIRGNENIELAKSVDLDGEVNESIFYKDMKFHKFGSRSKPMKLLWGEEFFSADHVKYPKKFTLPSVEAEGAFNKCKENSLNLFIKSIETSTPTDLMDQANWRVHCTNGLVIECENLFYGESPDTFFEFFENKSELSSEFVAFCESTKTPCALYVHIESEEKITERDETFFFPLSFTHEWGHFIGEFEDAHEGQIAKFMTFVNKEESSEEDISKKIRLLKKNLEKNFDTFKGENCKEYVLLKERAYCPKIDDSILGEDSIFDGKLSFFSFNAPFVNKFRKEDNFEDSWLSSSLLTRALLVQRCLTSSI